MAVTAFTVHQKALGSTILSVLVVTGLLWAVFKADLKSVVFGADHRPSTSKVQPLLWTISLATAFIYAGFVAFYDPAVTSEPIFGRGLQEEYFLLLGGPFAAALLARQIVTSKLAGQTLQKVDAPNPAEGTPAPNATESQKDPGFVRHIVGDDNGHLDLVDLQYLLFNLVALGWFWVGVAHLRSPGLPSLPPTLVGLTSAAALTYVGNKATLANAPIITSTVPSATKPYENLVIRGRNFVPAGSPAVTDDLARGIKVTIGGMPALVIEGKDSEVRVTVPHDPEAKAGEDKVEIKLMTAAGVEAAPVYFERLDATPVLSGLSVATARPGDTIRLVGRGFRFSLEPNQPPQVLFGESVSIRATTFDDEWAEVVVPDPIGLTALRVEHAGGRSEKKELIVIA